MWVGGIVGWSVDRGAGVGVVISNGIIFKLDDGYDMGYTGG